MDTNAGTHFPDIADHRDDVVSLERATSVRKADASATKTVASPAGEGWYHDAAIASAAQDVIEARGNPYHH